MTICAAALGLLLGSARAEPARPLVLENATTIGLGGTRPARTSDVSVLVVDGQIHAVGDPEQLRLPADVQRIDATGLSVLPGLADLHVHLWDEGALGAYLGAGITTIRNLSGMPLHLELQRRIASGALEGPRLLTSGPILNSAGPNQQINHQLVETAESAREAVRWQHEAGFRRLKLYSNLRREPYEAILDEARALDMVLTGHSPEGERLGGMPHERPFSIGLDEIIDDGFETLEHAESLLWHGLADRRDARAGRRLARRLVRAEVTVTPTLVAHHNLVRVAQTGGAFAQRPGIERLNPAVRQLEADQIARWAEQPVAPAERRDQDIAWLTGLLHARGVRLVTGSDAGIFVNVPGESLFDELDLLVAAGLEPFEALQAATHNAAIALGEEGVAGCVGVGCRADLVLYACDPLSDIRCVRQPHAVVRGGRWLDRAHLDQLLERAASQDPQRTLENFAEGMAAQGTPLDPATPGP